jgi:hypothetical protein
MTDLGAERIAAAINRLAAAHEDLVKATAEVAAAIDRKEELPVYTLNEGLMEAAKANGIYTGDTIGDYIREGIGQVLNKVDRWREAE